jgi:hypothetical protein
MTVYYNDYPTKPIGGRNPYQCCAYCSVSQPAIYGVLENHQEWCEYRRLKTLEQELELAELEIECLKLDAQKPVYCVAEGWRMEGEGGGEDVYSMKLFQEEEKALAYKTELEAGDSFCPSFCYVEIVQKSVN